MWGGEVADVDGADVLGAAAVAVVFGGEAAEGAGEVVDGGLADNFALLQPVAFNGFASPWLCSPCGLWVLVVRQELSGAEIAGGPVSSVITETQPPILSSDNLLASPRGLEPLTSWTATMWEPMRGARQWMGDWAFHALPGSVCLRSVGGDLSDNRAFPKRQLSVDRGEMRPARFLVSCSVPQPFIVGRWAVLGRRWVGQKRGIIWGSGYADGGWRGSGEFDTRR